MNETSSVASPVASKPFKLRIDPSKAVAHESWSAARKEAIAALTARKSALLLGPPGVGKTLMLAALAQELEQNGCRVHLFSKEPPPPPGTFEQSDKPIVLVDDARRLSDAKLQDLLAAPGLCCLLADQPSLAADIARLSPAPLPAIRLAPLSPGQSRRFVAAQIAQSGRAADLLGRDAVERLVTAAGGIPRAICTIGSRAVYLADLHNDGQVGASHIEKAVSLLPPSAIQPAEGAFAPVPDDDGATPYALAGGAKADGAGAREAADSKRGSFPLFPLAIGSVLACGALIVVLAKPAPSAHAPVAEAAASPAPAAPATQQDHPAAPVSTAEAPNPAAPAEAAPTPAPAPSQSAEAPVATPTPVLASVPAPPSAPPQTPAPLPKAEPAVATAAPPESQGAEQTALAAAPPPPPAPHRTAAPDMVELPGEVFAMGSNNDPSEAPVHSVTVGRFQIARHAVTVGEWQPCLDAKACTLKPDGPPDAPVTNASYADAQQFIAWLSATAGETFRLPTEAEWEYAARAGSRTRYAWGNAMVPGKTGCKTCGPAGAHGPASVTAYPPNAFGLYAMGGGVAEWVSDCWHRDYHGAPATAAAPWDTAACSRRVLRGGSWMNGPDEVTASARSSYDASVRYPSHGFRLAKSS